MTLDEMLAKVCTKTRRKAHADDAEHRLQAACVRAFNLKYPRLRGRLFAVPNGGRRDAVTGARMKAEGVVAGVSDLILLCRTPSYGALLIEMKRPGGKQSACQRRWQSIITEGGDFKYVICCDINAFMHEVSSYLKNCILPWHDNGNGDSATSPSTSISSPTSK